MKKLFLTAILIILPLACYAAITLTPPSGVTVPGSDKEVIFNDGGVLGADSTFIFDKATGNLGVGTSVNNTEGRVNILNASGTVTLGLFRFSDVNFDGASPRTFRARGTEGTPAAVQSGDRLSEWRAMGHNGTDFVAGPAIRFQADQNWTGTANGSILQFRTVENDTTGSSTRMHIDHNGFIGIGTTVPGDKLSVANGTVRVIQSIDGTAINLRLANDQAAAGGSTNEDVTIFFGHALLPAAAIIVGRENDYTSGANQDAFMAFNTVENGVDNEAMRINSAGEVGIGTTTPSSAVHIKSDSPGTVGSDAAGQVIIQALGTSINTNAIVTGYNSDGSGLPNQQLWYFGSSSSSNSNITLLNRLSADLTLGTNNLTRMTIGGLGDVVISNFTKLGSDAPNIKMKKLTGTGGTVEGWTTNVAHGLGDITKIISATVLLTPPNSNLIPPGFTVVAEFEYDFFIDPTNVKVIATATNSGSILASSSFVILLTLEK